MRLLLDTHALIWWLLDDARLSRKAYGAIEEGEVFVSAASVWELATKHRLGRLPDADPLMHDLPRALADEFFVPLAITLSHARAAGGLPAPHRDPFDRLLVAQAMLEDLWLVSNERPFDAYGVKRLW